MLDHRVLAGRGRHDRRRSRLGIPGLERRHGAAGLAASAGPLPACVRPGIPAYTIRTPSRPGSYRLLVLDQPSPSPRVARLPDRGGPRGQPAHVPRAPARGDGPSGRDPRGTPDRLAASAWELTLANTSSVYVQAQVFRQHLSTCLRLTPACGLNGSEPVTAGSSCGSRRSDAMPGTVEVAREIPMPQDLPPGGRLKVTVPADRLPPSWASLALRDRAVVYRRGPGRSRGWQRPTSRSRSRPRLDRTSPDTPQAGRDPQAMNHGI